MHFAPAQTIIIETFFKVGNSCGLAAVHVYETEKVALAPIFLLQWRF